MPFAPMPGAADPWGNPWGGAAPLTAESGFGLESEPLLMFFEMGAPAAPTGGGLASLVPEVAAAVRLLPEVAAGQREAAETLAGLLQRFDGLQRQVETLSARLAAGALAAKAAAGD